MEYNKVQFGTLVLIDLTNDTAKVLDVASDKYFHTSDGSRKKGGLTVMSSGSVYNALASKISKKSDKLLDINMVERIFRTGSIVRLTANTYLGEASASNIPSNQSFSSKEGFNIKGTMNTTLANKDKVLAGDYFLDSYSDDNYAVSKYIGTTDKFCMLGNNNLYMTIPKANFGDATASDVRKGKTFTSANGVKITGTGNF